MSNEYYYSRKMNWYTFVKLNQKGMMMMMMMIIFNSNFSERSFM